MLQNTGPASARMRLIEAAIGLLAESGPSDVKARSVAARAGTSTMGVYSHFGSVPELLRAVADEGFRRQAVVFESTPRTADPMANLYLLALSCCRFAADNRLLYDLMFGLSIDGRYNSSRVDAAKPVTSKTPEFEVSFAYPLRESLRLVESGVLPKHDPPIIAMQFWSSLHGFIMLDLGGHFAEVADPIADLLGPMCVNLVVGMGARREAAELSLAIAEATWSGQPDISGSDAGGGKILR